MIQSGFGSRVNRGGQTMICMWASMVKSKGWGEHQVKIKLWRILKTRLSNLREKERKVGGRVCVLRRYQRFIFWEHSMVKSVFREIIKQNMFRGGAGKLVKKMVMEEKIGLKQHSKRNGGKGHQRNKICTFWSG